jgi:diguanylate cyclase (GGDEF)-like protein/PAS domain S-box-containing protein
VSDTGRYASWHRHGATTAAIIGTLAAVATVATDEMSTDVLLALAGYVTGLVVLLQVVKDLRPRAWLATWSVWGLIGMTALSTIAPQSTQLTVGVTTFAFLFAGLTLPPKRSLWLLPIGVGMLLVVLDTPPMQTVVRVCVLVAVWVALAEFPSRLLDALRREKAALRRERADLVQVKEQLSDSLRRFTQLFEASPVGIALLDDDHRFVEVNERLVDMAQVPRERLLGLSALAVIDVEDGLPIWTAESGTAPEQVEQRYVLPDGTERWAWLSFVSVPGDDQRSWTLGYIQDVTDRKQAELTAERSQRVLEAAAAVARAASMGEDPRHVVLEGVASLVGSGLVGVVERESAGTWSVVTLRDGVLGRQSVPDAMVTTSLREAWQTGKPLVRTDGPLAPAVLERPAQAMAWHPVVLDGQTQAVLTIAWRGEDDVRPQEFQDVLDVITAEMAAALAGERLRHQLQEMAARDPLTGLSNRRDLALRFSQLTERAAADGTPVTVVILDLDLFKRFNDTHGHLAGDDLLRTFAGRIRATIRRTDLAGRWGGEEFVLVLDDCPAEKAQQIVDAVRSGVPRGQTCSVGYTQWRRGETLESVVARADDALYQAKDAGRDRAVGV